MKTKNIAMTFRICLKALWHGRLKTILLMGVCAFSIGVCTSLFGLVYDVRSQMNDELKSFGPNFIVQSAVGRDHGIEQNTFLDLQKKFPEESLLAPNLFGFLKVKGHELLVWGTRFDPQSKMASHWEIRGAWAGMPEDAMLGDKAARRLNLHLSDHFRFDGVPGKIFVVRGIFKTGDPEDDQVLISLDAAHELMGSEVWLSSVYGRLQANVDTLNRMFQTIQKDLPEVEIKLIRRVALSEQQVLDKVENLVWIVTVVISAMTCLTIMAIATTLVSERREEFALSSVMGASKKFLSALFYFQMVMAGFAASPAGFVLGFGGLQFFARHIFSTDAVFRWQIIPILMLGLLAVIILGAAAAVRRISAIEPAIALRGE